MISSDEWWVLRGPLGYVYQDAFGDLGFGKKLDVTNTCLLWFTSDKEARLYADRNQLGASPIRQSRPGQS